MANKMYWASALTGGAEGALDAIDGAGLSNGDAALVLTSTGGYLLYFLNATSGQSESSPDIITPDLNPGTKRWILTNVLSPRVDANEIRAKGASGLKLMDDSGSNGIAVFDGGIIRGAAQPAARAYRSSTQSIPTGAATRVNFNAESYDVGSNYDNATNYRFVVPTNGAGKYLVVVSVAAATTFSTPNEWRVMIYKNGAEHTRASDIGNTDRVPHAVCVDILDLAAGDYVQGYVYHAVGASINAAAGSNLTFMSIIKLW